MELKDRARIQCVIYDIAITDAMLVLHDDFISIAQDEIVGRDDPITPPYTHLFCVGRQNEWDRIQAEYSIKPITALPKYNGKLRITIYGEEGTQDKIVRLKLQQTARGISVLAVDERGSKVNAGCLLTFRDDGSVDMATHINSNLGLQLNSLDGSLKTYK